MTGRVRGVLRFLQIPATQRRAVVSGVMMVPRVARSLRDRGYARTRDWLATRPRPHPGRPLSDEALRRADLAIRRLPWNMRCLERSLVVWWLAGDDSVIRFGVAPRTADKPHVFHAWVERDGLVVNDHPDVASHFLPLSADEVGSADPLDFG